MPVVRLVWCKGARIELLAQNNIRPQDRQLELRAWSAEPEGWFGVLVDPIPGTPPALVSIDSARTLDDRRQAESIVRRKLWKDPRP